ncbi:STAS domain-containing protein [Streptomyces sp. H39-S7]|uniref:STAS domain-containing protein n=1 Tax=Streptomyces sp. H39-S7 TaxID=3004357 RepID=UPI0022B07690|nr:STAS domain-containing protein [Streptomyces sp. H39-S7]MCZ4120999.1 STAS domain-containing protein [Streptomyces sp. H39-S7]
MDLIAGGPLQITLRRYGPTLHLTLAGELDIDAEPAIAQVMSTLPADVAVIACDLHHIAFMDVVGVRCVRELKRSAEQRGLAALVYNWRPQPLQLLNLLDGLERDNTPSCEHSTPSCGNTATPSAPSGSTPPGKAPRSWAPTRNDSSATGGTPAPRPRRADAAGPVGRRQSARRPTHSTTNPPQRRESLIARVMDHRHPGTCPPRRLGRSPIR